MKAALRIELLHHIIAIIKDNEMTDFEDLHFHAFNEDYYIVGYYQAEEWLKKHDIDVLQALEDILEWEQNNFGEVHLKSQDINYESIVNLYVHIKGEELLFDLDLEQAQQGLLSDLEMALEELSEFHTEWFVSKMFDDYIKEFELLAEFKADKSHFENCFSVYKMSLEENNAILVVHLNDYEYVGILK